MLAHRLAERHVVGLFLNANDNDLKLQVCTRLACTTPTFECGGALILSTDWARCGARVCNGGYNNGGNERKRRRQPSKTTYLHGARPESLTLPEELNVCEKYLAVVRVGQPAEVFATEATQVLAQEAMELRNVDVVKAIFANGKLEPHADVLVVPKKRVCVRSKERADRMSLSNRKARHATPRFLSFHVVCSL